MKKKASKKTENKSVIRREITGLIFITISILLFFSIGLVSKYANLIVFYLLGTPSYILYIGMFVYGLGTMIRRFAHFFNGAKIAALVMLLISFAVFFSIGALNEGLSIGEYSSSTIKSLLAYVKSDDRMIITNGGIVGYIFTSLFVKMLSVFGTVLVFVVVTIISILLLFQRSIKDYFHGAKKVSNKTKPVIDKVKKKKVVKEVADTVPVDKKIPIFNFDEVTEPALPVYDEADIFDEEVVEKEVEIDAVNVKSSVNANYKLPPLSLLNDAPIASSESGDKLKSTATLLVQTLSEFGVSAKVVSINTGPTVTQYELEITAGTKLSKIRGLSGEISLALAAKDVRIQAPIPSKSTIGIEIPNSNSSMVTLKQILNNIPKNTKDKTTVGLGKDILGKAIYFTLSSMPHLLVAGATGSGKSVCINSIIISIAMNAKPSEVKMLMIDPKKVELSGYNGLPHLLAPVVTDPRKAASALQKIVGEMEKRYDLLSDSGSKNIESYNAKMLSAGFEKEVLPYIIVIVDELADLMLVASKEVEDSIMRITQMARAAGIHLIIATQRPSTDVITGVIKANIPSRIAFGVSSSIDSRTILDSMGAEKLLGKGDMLFMPMGTNHPMRVQGAYVSENEVERVVNYCVKQQIAQYDENILSIETENSEKSINSDDDMYQEVLEFVIENGAASTSLLQRRFRIGYNRASRLIDDLEANGIIGPANGSKPRDVIVEY